MKMQKHLGRCCFGLVALVVLSGIVRMASASWGTNGSTLCKAANIQDQPAIAWAVDSDNKGIYRGSPVVWRDFRSGDTDPDIYAQFVELNSRKRWPNVANAALDGIPICTAPGVQRDPRVTVTPLVPEAAKIACFGWIDERDSSPRIYVNACMVDEPNGTLVPGGRRVCLDEHEQRSFDISPTFLSNSFVVVWADKRDEAKDFDIYAQKIKITQNDLERVWGDNGVLVCSADGKQAKPRIVISDAGHEYYVVVWEDDRRGTSDRDLFAQELDKDGALKWAATGKPVCDHAGQQQNFDVAASGWLGGKPLIAWQDHRDATTDSLTIDIYAQALDADGEQIWPADGAPVCVKPGAQLRPRVTRDDNGGVYVAWLDKRDAPAKIYDQRVNKLGAVVWKDGGVGVAIQGGDESRAGYAVGTLSSDDLAITYTTLFKTVGSPDEINIMCSYVRAADGLRTKDITLCGAARDQYQPAAVIGPGSFDVMAAWRDNRKTDAEADIYATYATFRDDDKQRQPDQQKAPVAGVGPPFPKELDVLQNQPNPFNVSTQLRIGLPHTSDVTVDVFDVAGRRVLQRRVIGLAAGWQHVMFEGRDSSGRMLASGVYFCRVTAHGEVATQKWIVQR
jgi:hypothetical protein